MKDHSDIVIYSKVYFFIIINNKCYHLVQYNFENHFVFLSNKNFVYVSRKVESVLE